MGRVTQNVPLKMHSHDRVPVLLLHFEERFIPQDAGIVDQDVNLTESLQCGFEDRLAAADGPHVGDGGDGLSAGCTDLPYDRVRRLCGVIIDYDRGTLAREQVRIGATESRTRTGNHGNLAIQQSHLAYLFGP